MIRKLIFLTVIAVVHCQYPEQRAPPLRHRPAPEEYYEDEYAPPPTRQAPPPAQQPAYRSANTRPLSDVYKPASVHYVNIGLELAGDYKFGYDTGKGNDGQSFREETRLPDGSVQGAYGYVDESGVQRIVKYTAGKEGFKVLKDDGAQGNTARSAPAPAPQPAYRAPPATAQFQPAPRPQPQPAYRPPPPEPQPAYRAPAPQPQPAYRAQPQPAYRAPAPQPQPAYRAPEPRPRSQPPRARPAPVETYEEPDYDYPNNDITERRLVPVDTTLFNYNIGTDKN